MCRASGRRRRSHSQPEISAAVDEAIADYRLSPSLYTPPSQADAPDGTKGTLGLPFATGGANFEGSGYDPETGMLYVPSVTHVQLYALTHEPEASDIDYIAGNETAPTVFDLFLVKPPLGRITAIDLTTGDHVWMIANGDTPKAYTDNPALEGIDLPRTGKPTRAGIVVTKSLLFAGEGWGTVGDIRGDPVFRAHDKQTGEIVAEIELPATQSGPPSTYMLNGRQYIVMMVTDGESPAELVALALPRSSVQ
jgi:quinoprotein glucose dehydrogenase